MSHYGILLPEFWDGSTGRALAAAGGAQAQLVALYLTSNRDANMIGLYHCRLAIMRERIGTLTTEAIARALAACHEAGFAEYDLATEHVWVREMAKFRLQLQNGPIHRKDKRATAATRLFDRLDPNPFLLPFFKRYRADLHLSKPRPFKGASKPVTGSVTGSGSEIRDQGSDPTGEDPDPNGYLIPGSDQRLAPQNFPVLERLAHDVLAEVHEDDRPPTSELLARLKDKAAKARIAYDSRVAAKALESAEHQRMH